MELNFKKEVVLTAEKAVWDKELLNKLVGPSDEATREFMEKVAEKARVEAIKYWMY